MEITIRVPKPTTALRWTLLVALVALAAVWPQPGPAAAAFPGANGRLAFDTFLDGNGEVYVTNSDGTNPVNLTNNPGYDFEADWSPNGAKIAFTAQRGHVSEVYVMNSDGTGQTMLTGSTATEDYQPDWSPSAATIAFASERDGNAEIYVMNPDGSSQTRITSNTVDDRNPAWSPDGTKIAFDSIRGGNRDIYVMDADGSSQTRLTSDAAADYDPAWSPDGAIIAFTTERDGNREVYVMDTAGTSQVNLTNSGAKDQRPDWSPDGSKIAYESDGDGDNEIFVMNADGSGQTNVTNNEVQDEAVSWESVQQAPTPQIGITNLGRYALPKTCFDVRDPGQNPLFVVCDNDFQGAPDAHEACAPDGVCDDEDPAEGSIRVTVAAGTYSAQVSKAPANHTPDPSNLECNAVDGKCALTFLNTPNTTPWHPWDLNGDGLVRAKDIMEVVNHYGQDKPLE